MSLVTLETQTQINNYVHAPPTSSRPVYEPACLEPQSGHPPGRPVCEICRAGVTLFFSAWTPTDATSRSTPNTVYRLRLIINWTSIPTCNVPEVPNPELRRSCPM
ncbi:Hypothetical protein CINCED_3A020096 [Cinara cedri]|uniref:Uncharacterized protein n=1 Tax=Cinara cedri TaxID=506608 RepID=A0A5E4ND70_9HEMI|nr:Hypothetical protein CINCED_3A020096 [Cinara cedri]